ncbi:hypothetical protein F443_07560 [Phytophthora nicotianae P1569]|uniref:Uncharacterized protein n=1 Tax=Phytophthora nicotianae P1569 TaxID=1317065 RepID=V9FCC2_PHYNI|nr:hypothetical protein F443_07560 [Phytophthora nicotianae P1569]
MVNQVELLQWYIMTRRNFSRKKKMRYLSLIDCVERPLIPNVSFDLARYTNANCEHEFRFDVAGIHELFSLLRIPDEVVTVYMARFTIAVLVSRLCAACFAASLPQCATTTCYRFLEALVDG